MGPVKDTVAVICNKKDAPTVDERERQKEAANRWIAATRQLRHYQTESDYALLDLLGALGILD